MTIMIGDGNIYSDNRTELEGDSSSINVEVAYLGKIPRLLIIISP